MSFYKMLVKDFPGFTGLVLGLWAVLAFLPSIVSLSNLGIAGQFGDSFGMATSFFTSAASLATGIALILQLRQTTKSEEAHEVNRRDGRRQLVLSTFMKIDSDMRQAYESIAVFVVTVRQTPASELMELTTRVLSSAAAFQANDFSLQMLFRDRARALISMVSGFKTRLQRWHSQPSIEVPEEIVSLMRDIRTEMLRLWEGEQERPETGDMV